MDTNASEEHFKTELFTKLDIAKNGIFISSSMWANVQRHIECINFFLFAYDNEVLQF